MSGSQKTPGMPPGVFAFLEAGIVGSMLTFEDMQRVLGELTYKPGWDLFIIPAESSFEGPEFYIRVTLEDSYHPGKMIPIGIRSYVPPFKLEDDFVRWVHWRLQRVETHECQEWFKRNGKVVFDPHADTKLIDGQPPITKAVSPFPAAALEVLTT